MLNRLRKKGLLKEYADKEDKRSKRLQLTAKGEKVVELCISRIYKTASMMAIGLSDADKEFVLSC